MDIPERLFCLVGQQSLGLRSGASAEITAVADKYCKWVVWMDCLPWAVCVPFTELRWEPELSETAMHATGSIEMGEISAQEDGTGSVWAK